MIRDSRSRSDSNDSRSAVPNWLKWFELRGPELTQMIRESRFNTVSLIGINLYSVLFLVLFVHAVSWMLLLNTPIVPETKTRFILFVYYVYL